jgi:RHS repeat-associated protein
LYTFDHNGNTIVKTDSTGNTSYTWDYENRMTSVILPGSGGTVSFKYDPFGRRIYKSSSSGTSIYAYDGDNLIEETNSSGTAVARYSQGLNIDEPLVMLRGGATSYYEADGLGSVTSLTNAAGTAAQTYTYDSFGNTVATSGSLVNSFQYTGREFDPETSLYYYRARYYDAKIGRFLTEDPIGYVGGDNFYSYVENDPTDLADPYGLCPPPRTKKPCDATLPSGPFSRTMVQTLMGEMSGQNMVGQDQYADDESGPLRSIGEPGGPEITNDTLDLEALLLAQTMLNLGHIGNSRTYPGLNLGKPRTAQALRSSPGSPLCIMLKRAISAVKEATNSPWTSVTKEWRAVVQGGRRHPFVRDLGNAIRVGGTDFLF